MLAEPVLQSTLDPRVARTPFHLSDEQIQFFDDNGYLILRDLIPKQLLNDLRAAGDVWIEDGWKHDAADDEMARDFVFAWRGDEKRVMFRVNYVHNKGQAASLQLLGCPQVLAVAESLCGPNFVPTYESMVFKAEGDGEAIPWHQDAVHPARKHRIFNLDVYLDHSKVGAGALRVIPGTQKIKQDICALTDAYGWDHPHAIDVEMAPGDVLLHNVMVVHGSDRTLGNALRRTIYYEFRSVEEILDDGPWDRAWIDQRLRLIPIAQRRWRHAYPTASQFAWNVSAEFEPRISGDEREELKIAHSVHMSGAHCSAGDAGHKKPAA
jgi:ectoine hydroxylase-related dioxygenase (phytanoyl-CoA dioxygenase family)